MQVILEALVLKAISDMTLLALALNDCSSQDALHLYTGRNKEAQGAPPRKCFLFHYSCSFSNPLPSTFPSWVSDQNSAAQIEELWRMKNKYLRGLCNIRRIRKYLILSISTFNLRQEFSLLPETSLCSNSNKNVTKQFWYGGRWK